MATTYDPNTHVVIRRHHVALGFLIALLLVGCAVAAGLWYGNDVTTQADGSTVIKVPSLNDVRDRIVHFRTPDGQTVNTVVQPPAPAAPDGPFVRYSSDKDGQPQRIEGKSFGIYDKLHGDIASLADVVKAQGDGLTAALKAQAANQKAGIDALSASIQGLATKVSDQGTKLDDVADRVTKLEKVQATPAPTPAPQPAPQVTPPAEAVPGPSSQAVPPAPAPAAVAPATQPVPPVPGPQASEQPPRQVAQAGGFVTKETASPQQLLEMYASGRALGRPSGGKVAGFAELHKGDTFACPNGNPNPIHLKHVHTEHGWADRWDCKFH